VVSRCKLGTAGVPFAFGADPGAEDIMNSLGKPLC